jgi:hypothetical protein
MNAAIASQSKTSPSLREKVEEFSLNAVQALSDSCGGFIKLYRSYYLEQEPTPDQEKVLRQGLRYLLMTLNLLEAAGEAEGAYGAQMFKLIEGRRIQLQHIREEMDNDMTQEEADRLIAEHFPPDESRA